MKNKSFLLIISQSLLLLILIISILARGYGASVYLFWPTVWALILLTTFIIVRSDRGYKFAALLVMALALSFIPLAALPEIYQIGRDNVFEVQYSSLIIEEGRWDPTLGVGFAQNYYGYNPGLHFILGLTSLTTGIDNYILSKFFFFILFRLILALCTFLLMRELMQNETNAILSTLIFIGSAGVAFVGVSRRSMASIFLIVAVYSLIKKGRYSIIFLITSALVVISNHTIAYYFLIFLAGAWVFSIIMRLFKQKFPKVTYHFIYYLLVFLAWELKFNVLLKTDAHYITDIMNTVMSGAGLASFFGQGGAGINIYYSYETYIIYTAQFLFLVLGAIGFLLYLRRSKINFLVYLSLFGFSMYALSAILMRTDLDVAVIVILWFFGIPACIFIVQLLRRMSHQLRLSATVLVVMLLFTGSLLMGIYTPRLTNRAPESDVQIGADIRSKSAELFFSGEWLSQNAKGTHVVGDVDVYETYSGFFRFNVNPSDTSLTRLYLGTTKDINFMINRDNIGFGSYAHTRYLSSADYFVMNRAFSRYYSEAFGNPIEFDTSKLDSINQLDRIYSNKEIHIYQVNRG